MYEKERVMNYLGDTRECVCVSSITRGKDTPLAREIGHVGVTSAACQKEKRERVQEVLPFFYSCLTAPLNDFLAKLGKVKWG